MKSIRVRKIIPVIIALFLAVVFASCSASAARETDYYPMAARVCDIDNAADVVTVETASGELFSYYGADGLEVGDLIACVMNDNGTPSDVTDDIIVLATPAGYNA